MSFYSKVLYQSLRGNIILKLMKGADPIYLKGGKQGVLMYHGFSTHPYGLREMAQAMADLGVTVSVPLQAGHGTVYSDLAKTTWKDWYQSGLDAYQQLKRDCDEIMVGGHSSGAALALYFAAHYDVKGIVCATTPIRMDDFPFNMMPLMSIPFRYLPFRPDTYETGDPEVDMTYDKVSTKAIVSFLELVRETRKILPKITAPVLLIQSRTDMLVPLDNVRLLFEEIGSEEKEVLWVEHSDHGLQDPRDKAIYIPKVREFVAKQFGIEAVGKE